MRVTGPTGDVLELTIVGYEFPDIIDARFDSNWLVIVVSATVRGKSWIGRDACLLTWEVAELSSWLDSLAEGAQIEPELDFLEPNLRFQVESHIADRTRLRVFFELEVRPRWAPSKYVGEPDLWATIECTSDELRAWEEDLRRQLSRFPIR